ncbi:MAG: tyrosine-type recombinase/integrase [Desulfobacteraceae bacterium]
MNKFNIQRQSDENQSINFKPNPGLKLMDQIKEVLRYDALCVTVLRHSFAAHMHENGVNIRALTYGHCDVKTTEVYTHVMQKDINSVKSPLD